MDGYIMIGKFPYIEVDEIKGVSGTLIRESVK